MTQFVVAVVSGLSVGGTYALVALGIVLAYRATGTFNFAHGQFMLFPAYLVAAWQASGSTPFGLSLVLALLLIAAIGAAFYLFVLQRTTGLPHFMAVIATFGLASVLDGAMLIIFGGRQYTLHVPGVPTGVTELFGIRVASSSLVLAAFTLLLASAVAATLRFTPVGRRIRASGQDPLLASQGGINVRRLHLASWACAAALAGVAGITFASTNIVEPTVAHIALAAFPAILLGGLDSIPGAIVGGAAIGLFQSFTVTYYGSAELEVATYTLLLVVMLVLPSGLFGTRTVTRV